MFTLQYDSFGPNCGHNLAIILEWPRNLMASIVRKFNTSTREKKYFIDITQDEHMYIFGHELVTRCRY
jgi:hypothetical protein